MKFSETKGRKVVALSTADTIGKVRSFLVDPASRSVVALRLKKTDQGDVVRWDDLSAFGADAITVEDPTAITELDGELEGLRGKRHRLLKKRVLTTGGDELGNVTDVEFDPDTGGLTNIILDGDAELAADRLVGVGSYAVIMQEQPDHE